MEPIEKQYRDYEEDSWDLWEETLISHKNRMTREDLNAYLPSPQEIEDRKESIGWLRHQGFDSSFICGVMSFEHPGINRVKEMVRKYGPEATYEKLKPFLIKTEYDEE